MKTPKKRIIYLNGVDTGLSAYSSRTAASAMANVLRRRGDLKATPEQLRQCLTTTKGRVDFTWPPADARRASGGG